MEQMDLFAPGVTAMTPQDRVEMVCYWARHNRNTFLKLRRIIDAEVTNPSRRVFKNGKLDHIVPLRREEAYVAAQTQGMSITQAREFRFDNNMWSVLSRVIIMQNPRAAYVLKPKKCAVDIVNIPKLWRENANAGDFFFAETWEAAAKLAPEFGELAVR